MNTLAPAHGFRDMREAGRRSMEAAVARRAWVYTPDRVAAVQADCVPGRSMADIAGAHGLTVTALQKARDRGLIAKPQVYRARSTRCVDRSDVVVELIPRVCLCCGKAFNAETKFIRSCDTCREKGSPLGDWGMGVV